MTIKLDLEQQKVYDFTIKTCCQIEAEMHTPVDPTNPAEVEAQLGNIIPWLANLSVLVSNSNAIYDWAKGEVATEIISKPDLMEAKQDILKNYIQGKLAKYSALFERVEALSKNLRSQVEGLRSILSYEKEQLNINRTRQ